MKLSVIISLIFLFFTQFTCAWPAPDFSNFLRWHSRVPSFILDIDHPWIKEKDNLFKLWRLDDPKSALCNLSCELRPSNASHGFTYPTDLFKTLQLDTKWSDDVWWNDWSNRLAARTSNWNYIMRQLDDIVDCPAALKGVEELNLQTHVPDLRSFVSGEWSNPPVMVGVPDMFVELLKSMPYLRKLNWNSFGENDDVFKESFSKANLTLPALRHLSVTSGTDFLIGMCPEIESIHYRQTMRHWDSKIETHPTIRLLQSLDSASNLKSLSLERTAWNLEHIEVLLERCPNLMNLTIGSDSWSPHAYFNMYGLSSEVPGERLKNLTNMLAGFQNLQNLWLPWVAELGLGWDGGSGCGNAYFGPDGRAYGRHETRRGVKATELATEIVLARLPQLKILSLYGEHDPKIGRDEFGQANATWPWTGRLTEYVFEVWPERYPGEDAEYNNRSGYYDEDMDTFVDF